MSSIFSSMRLLRSILVLLMSLIPSFVMASGDAYLTLIVNRDDDSAVYYLAMPSEDIPELLATDLSLVFSDGGAVPIDEFREYGSFELADEVFANVKGKAGDRTLNFEAMSMMVHPLDSPQPFATPWDGVTAISVCTVDYEKDALLPAGLQLYYGAYTDGLTPEEPLSIAFPATGREAFPIVIHRYQDGVHQSTDRAVLEDGGTLVIPANEAKVKYRWLWLSVSAFLFFFAAALLRLRFSNRSPEAAS